MVLQVDEICSSVCVLYNVKLHLMVVLRTESADTQCQSFKDIVDTVTLFPGLGAYFLKAKYMEGSTTTEAISVLWNRDHGPPEDEWTFWQTLAATCLGDTTVSTILEDSTVLLLTTCDTGRLSVIERLIVEHDCS
jgi:hypothetical protein